MPDLRDAFRLSTDHVAPEPGALDRQLRRQRKRTTRRKASAFASVAAVLALVAAVILATQPGGEDDQIAVPPGPEGLFSLDVTTGELTPFHDPGEGAGWFELSPDGTRLLMTFDAPGPEIEFQLWIANADGTGARVLVPEDAQRGVWFPDSRRIAYSGIGEEGDVRQIQILDLETGRLKEVTSETMDARDPAVSPDGRSIVFSTTSGSIVDRPYVDFQGVVPSAPPRGLLKRVDLGTGETVTLYEQEAGWVYNPDISPRTGQVVFGEWVSNYPNMSTEDSLLRVVPLEGGRTTVLRSSGDAAGQYVDMPLWSPDGSLLAYRVDGDDTRAATWVYDPASGEHRPVGPGWPETWLDDGTILVGT